MVKPDLDLDDLHPSLADDDLLSMNFLSEVALRYPKAISFASGRPIDEHFDAADVHRWLDLFLAQENVDARSLFQYGPAKGVIAGHVARQLAVDEGIDVDPASIIVTVGAQEGLHLVLRALRRDEKDAVLAVTPTYVGLTGAARTMDLPVFGVSDGADGIDLDDLDLVVAQVRDKGLRPRALYLMPDFANPSGRSMGTATRHRLLAAAAAHGLLLIEDNPYGFFGPHRPTLKALDTGRQVVHVGTFAKTVLPGARVGFVVADQRVAGGALLADELAKLKSMVTVNTSTVAQAVIGGRLIEAGYRLREANAAQIAVYRRNRDQMLAGLARRITDPQITWNTPDGGFFLVVDVPFVVDDALLERAGREHGVLFTPMSYFLRGGRATSQMRLSFSRVSPDEIETGLDRLTALLSSGGARV
ncbi:aminotransferase-like domain-containing protein [Kineosporia babensis]|uniref:PLP-dependent aminotransferase family protein n=1 Tax=Kineosporia babensis TaxID=499548 RepID=A0A9X1NBJ1_9ACTN|nr:PLP-dependent aminotransferase family protein [Kineosporia babensis]